MIERIFGRLFVAGVLAFQLWVIFPPRGESNHWYWPFVNYPMYSRAHLPGETVREHAVRVRFASEPAARGLLGAGVGEPVSADLRTISVTHEDLRLRRFAFYRSLERIAGWASGTAGWDTEEILEEMRLLELGISTYLSAPDSVILVRREFPVGRGGLEDRNPPWQVVYAWASLTVRGEAIGGREGRGQ